MKKIIMSVLFLLGIVGAGAGYYMFYYAPSHGSIFDMYVTFGPKPEEEPVDPQVNQAQMDIENPDIMDYYVDEATLPIRSKNDVNAFIEGTLYRGDAVHLLEKKNGWGRITEYFVYQENRPATAKWIPLDGLITKKPEISANERRETILSYIDKSDDMGKYEETFINTTNDLLKQKRCKPDDFMETGGWVRSVNFSKEDVYFVYCGGMKRVNKIYLNAQNAKVFGPDDVKR